MATLQLNQTNCEMVQCGAIPAATLNDPANNVNGMAFATACTAAGWQGPLGGRFCDDPVCGPYKEQIMNSGWGQGLECCVEAGGQWTPQNTCVMPSGGGTTMPAPTPAPMPSMTISTMPTVTGTANQVGQPQAPVLTAQMLTQKLPSIVNPAPAVVSGPACSDDFATWVNNNALLVMAGLAGLAYVMLAKK